VTLREREAAVLCDEKHDRRDEEAEQSNHDEANRDGAPEDSVDPVRMIDAHA
jgi:hypothetical protein